MPNLLKEIPADLPDELFQQLVSNDKFTIERIVSKGHCSPENHWYDQQNNEWVLLIKGEAILEFNDQRSVHLNEGDYLNIPAHERHRVKWTANDRETIWLAIHY